MFYRIYRHYRKIKFFRADRSASPTLLGMGKNKKGRGTISGVVDQKVIKMIDERRDRLSLSRSMYLALIVQSWMDAGGPPVSPAEKTIADLAKVNLPPSKRR